MTRRSAFLGIDLGSSEVRAGLVTADGDLLGLARARYASTVDATRGIAEQDPVSWWDGLRSIVPGLVREADVEIEGIGIDGHGPTLTVVDRAGRPVRPALTWLDTRSAAEADDLARATGLGGWALGILPAALWVARHEPEASRRAAWFMNSWDALTLRLTGEARASTVPGATMPSVDALAAVGLDLGRLPSPVRAGERVGVVTSEAAKDLGIRAGTPVVGGVVDAFATFHGAGMLERGDAVDAGGSAGGFGVYWDKPLQAAGSFTGPSPLAGLWIVGGAMSATGRAVEWLRDDVFGGLRRADELIDEAAAIEPGAEGLVFLPYLSGERSPIWDPDARGAFVGLTLAHGRAHLMRAVLEGAAFAIRHIAEPILEAGIGVRAMRVCGGPARSDDWNQLKADVTGFPVEVPRILETAIVGSAVLAATGTGAFSDIPSAIRAMTAVTRRLEPDPERAEVYGRTFRAYASLHPALGPTLAILRGDA